MLVHDLLFQNRTKLKWVFFSLKAGIVFCISHLAYSFCHFKTISQIHKITQKHMWDMHTISSLKKKKKKKLDETESP